MPISGPVPGLLRDMGSVGTLIGVHTDEVNGLNDQVEEWEEVELLVDSGASDHVSGIGLVRKTRESDGWLQTGGDKGRRASAGGSASFCSARRVGGGARVGRTCV